VKGEAGLVKDAKSWLLRDNTSMLRDPSLVPLSRQHQHALALCVRIDRAMRAGPVELAPWQAEIARDFAQEIQFHFAAEEQVLFPMARRFADLSSLANELIAEHGQLRGLFSRAQQGTMGAADLREFAEMLSSHIRKEERQLFEGLQKVLSREELALLGAQLEQALQSAVQACRIPNPTPEALP
jgi:hemerythrin-like domain-containing protein